MPSAAEGGMVAAVLASSPSADEEELPPEGGAAAGAVSGEPPEVKACTQWEAELWLLMRSLRNVVEGVGSGFGEVRLAQVCTTGDCCFHLVRERVLGYIQREAPRVLPIITYARVP